MHTHTYEFKQEYLNVWDPPFEVCEIDLAANSWILDKYSF